MDAAHHRQRRFGGFAKRRLLEILITYSTRVPVRDGSRPSSQITTAKPRAVNIRFAICMELP